MKLNKLKHYQPNNTGGGDIIDQPFSSLWAGDTAKGRSANSIYNLVESFGKLSRVIVVDALYGNDYSATPPMQSGQRESMLRPFKNINVAIYFMQAGDVMVVMPGTYPITNFPGLSPKNNTTFLLVNAVLSYNGSYSPFFTYPTGATGVKVIGIGSSSILKTSRNGWGGAVTPYAGPTQIDFYNLTINATEQATGSLGQSGNNDRITNYYNCKIYQNDSQVLTYAGGGSRGCSILMKNCYIKGYTYINGMSTSRPEYLLKAVDCFFEAIATNYNGRVNILDIGEYYGESFITRTIFERCAFKSAAHAIEVGVGYGGLGTNKKLVVSDCKFVTGSAGWIVNNHPVYEFKLLNNYITNIETGSYPVSNLLSAPGTTLEPNLEIYPD